MKRTVYVLLCVVCIFTSAQAQVKIIPGGNVVMSRPLDPSTYVLIGESEGNFPFFKLPSAKLNVKSYYAPSLVLDHYHNNSSIAVQTLWTNAVISRSNMFNAKHWTVAFDKLQTFGVTTRGWSFAFAYYNLSDSGLKKNIEPIENPMAKLMLLRGVSYKFKPSSYCGDSCSSTDSTALEAEPRHYGFISQEVKEVLPELVKHFYRSDSLDSALALNYIEIIPLLLEGIKYQQQQIAALQAQVQACCPMQYYAPAYDGQTGQPDSLYKDSLAALSQGKKQAAEKYTVPAGKGSSAEQARLFQNSPNPFNSSTNISFYIPPTASEARLFVYNLQGEQLKAYKIDGRGNASLSIKGSELKAGIYLYTLVVDQAEVATRRMILTRQ